MASELDERIEARVAQLLRNFDVDHATETTFDHAELRQTHEARWVRRADRRARAIALGTAAALVAAAGVSIGVLASAHSPASLHSRVGPLKPVPKTLKPLPKTPTPIVVGPHVVLTSEDESEMEALLAKYRAKPGVTRAAAKLVPYTDVEMIPGVRGGSPVASPPSLVVAIALSGQIATNDPVATLANGAPDFMTYELLIVNLSSGAVLSDTGGRPDTWPDGFDAMPDLPVGSVVPVPAALQLSATDDGKTFVVAPSSTVTVVLAGSAVEQWQLPPTPDVDSPVLVETSATNDGGSLASTWTAAIDGTQTISSQITCPNPAATGCTPNSWSVTVEVSG